MRNFDREKIAYFASKVKNRSFANRSRFSSKRYADQLSSESVGAFRFPNFGLTQHFRNVVPVLFPSMTFSLRTKDRKKGREHALKKPGPKLLGEPRLPAGPCDLGTPSS